jgi:hypothetical protein
MQFVKEKALLSKFPDIHKILNEKKNSHSVSKMARNCLFGKDKEKNLI